MAMGREGEVQSDLVVTWAEMPRSPGHAFYEKLHNLLTEAGFDAYVETTCKPYYAPRMGAPSLPAGRYFRMHMVGYFEGIDSERGIVWRCSDSFSLRDFLRLANRDKVPDHSWLSKTRSRLPHEVHEKVFGWVLNLVGERGLVKGERIGVDGSTMEANAALRTIIRRDTGETYRQMLTRMAQESGVETPTIDDLIRLDRKRKVKKLSTGSQVATASWDMTARIWDVRVLSMSANDLLSEVCSTISAFSRRDRNPALIGCAGARSHSPKRRGAPSQFDLFKRALQSKKYCNCPGSAG
jgi:transposase